MIIDKFPGLRNNVPTERFNPGELSIAKNVLINDDEQVRSRPGASAVVLGVNFHSIWAQDDLCFLAKEDQLCRLDKTLTSMDTLRFGLTLNAPVSYAHCDGKTFWCNGYENGIVEHGQSRSWGIVPPSVFSAEVIAGNLDAGKYQYTMTYLREDGQESGATNISTVELIEKSGIRFSGLPESLDSGVIGKRLYLSTANGEILYELDSLLNVTTEYSVTDAELSIPGETIFSCEPPPGAHLVAEYFGHLLIAVDDLVYFSKTYGPELFDWLDYYPFDTKITMIAPTSGGVFVGTENKTYFMSGTAPSDFVISEKCDYGIVKGTLSTGRSGLLRFQGVDETIFSIWRSRKGICAGLSDGTLYNLTNLNYKEDSTTSHGASIIRDIDGSTYYHATV